MRCLATAYKPAQVNHTHTVQKQEELVDLLDEFYKMYRAVKERKGSRAPLELYVDLIKYNR